MNELSSLAALRALSVPLDVPVFTAAHAQEILTAWPALRSLGYRPELPAWVSGLTAGPPIASKEQLREHVSCRVMESMGVLAWERWSALREMPEMRPEVLGQVRAFSVRRQNNGPDERATLAVAVEGGPYDPDTRKAFDLAWDLELASPSGPLHDLLGVLGYQSNDRRLVIPVASQELMLEGFLGELGYRQYKAFQIDQGLPEAAPVQNSKPRF